MSAYNAVNALAICKTTEGASSATDREGLYILTSNIHRNVRMIMRLV